MRSPYIPDICYKTLQVGLAEALDVYFEDIYSLPRKQLPCDAFGNYGNLPSEKV